MSGQNNNICQAAWILILVGAFNWGLVGLGHFAGFDGNLVNVLLGSMPTLENIIYLLVGLSAICKAANFGKCSK